MPTSSSAQAATATSAVLRIDTEALRIVALLTKHSSGWMHEYEHIMDTRGNQPKIVAATIPGRRRP